jgi:hypothetical protein
MVRMCRSASLMRSYDAQCARDSAGRPCEIVFHLELDDARAWILHVPEQSQAPTRETERRFTDVLLCAPALKSTHVTTRRCSLLDDCDEVGFRIYGA